MVETAASLPLVRSFFEYDLESAVHVLEGMTEEEAAEVLKSLPVTLAVRVVKALQIGWAATLLKQVDDGFLIEMTSHLDPQLATSILMHLPRDVRERMSKHISDKLKGQIRELLEYPEGSIGRAMTTDFIALKKDSRAEEAIERIRSLAKKRFPSSYVYVVDDDNRLFGVLNMRDLMLAAPDERLEEICHLILKEGKIGAINGAVIGVVTALAAWVWYGNPFLGLVIGLGMLVNLIVAGLSGAAIPLLMKKIGIDPAQSSSIILTTVTDVLGFFAFLGFAVVFQNLLISS